MEKRSQATTEYLLLLGAVILIVGAIMAMIIVATSSLGDLVSGEIDNTRSSVINELVGMLLS